MPQQNHFTIAGGIHERKDGRKCGSFTIQNINDCQESEDILPVQTPSASESSHLSSREHGGTELYSLTTSVIQNQY